MGAPLKNEIGNKYRKLTIISRGDNTKDGHARWNCQCDCGNMVLNVLGKHLRSGNTQSCGCLQRERTAESNFLREGGSIIGEKFGKLLVIEDMGFIKGYDNKNKRIYKCLCDCGNTFITKAVYLKTGDALSCGCLRSKGEKQIESILQNNNKDFKREFHFDDLKDKYPLRFDFALFEKDKIIGLIEFQGEQHYIKRGKFYKEQTVIHDKMKKDYCNINNIKLFEIKFNENIDTRMEEILNELYS